MDWHCEGLLDFQAKRLISFLYVISSITRARASHCPHGRLEIQVMMARLWALQNKLEDYLKCMIPTCILKAYTRRRSVLFREGMEENE